MIRTMLRTGGTLAVSVGALLAAGSMNLAVLNEGPSGPGHIVLRAAAGTTTTSTTHHQSHTAELAVAVDSTTSTTAGGHRHTLTRSTDP